jgi:hypothetical protein
MAKTTSLPGGRGPWTRAKWTGSAVRNKCSISSKRTLSAWIRLDAH